MKRLLVLLMVLCLIPTTVYADESIKGTGWDGKNTDGSPIVEEVEEVAIEETAEEVTEEVVEEEIPVIEPGDIFVDSNNVWSYGGMQKLTFQQHFLHTKDITYKYNKDDDIYLWDVAKGVYNVQVLMVNQCIAEHYLNCVPSLQLDMTKSAYVSYDKWTDVATVSIPHKDGFYSWTPEYIGWALEDGTVKAARMEWNPLTANFEYKIENYSETYDFARTYEYLREGKLLHPTSICIYGAKPL